MSLVMTPLAPGKYEDNSVSEVNNGWNTLKMVNIN
jgi:hypothetical protein